LDYKVTGAAAVDATVDALGRQDAAFTTLDDAARTVTCTTWTI
jgi:hypothetical protein